MKRIYNRNTKTISIHLKQAMKTRNMKKVARQAIRECPETADHVRIMVRCGREYRKVFEF